MRASLSETDVAADPIQQFQRWFDEALRAELPTVNAMTLATVDAAGAPSARIVLLKGIDQNGFVFYTNYQSRKGRELAANPRASLVFHWIDLEREVRIDGRVEKVTAAESDEYFASRPLGSRHAAIASPQSETVASRDVLEARFAAAAADHGETPARPAHWGPLDAFPPRALIRARHCQHRCPHAPGNPSSPGISSPSGDPVFWPPRSVCSTPHPLPSCRCVLPSVSSA
jgi:pyridoxamine 5'-phosphate oxidase